VHWTKTGEGSGKHAVDEKTRGSMSGKKDAWYQQRVKGIKECGGGKKFFLEKVLK